MTDPLSGPTDAPWSRLRCAYGPADAVPGFLRDAASEDPARRAAGVAELWQNVWHQALANEHPLTHADLVAHAAVDEEAADHLAHIAEWPAHVQAVELVRELSERTVAGHLTQPD